MDDFDDARVFLGDRPAIVAPMTLRLQFREAGWKARRHGFGDEGAPLHLRHGAGWPARGRGVKRHPRTRVDRSSIADGKAIGLRHSAKTKAPRITALPIADRSTNIDSRLHCQLIGCDGRSGDHACRRAFGTARAHQQPLAPRRWLVHQSLGDVVLCTSPIAGAGSTHRSASTSTDRVARGCRRRVCCIAHRSIASIASM